MFVFDLHALKITVEKYIQLALRSSVLARDKLD
jgi:hypothetical protein